MQGWGSRNRKCRGQEGADVKPQWAGPQGHGTPPRSKARQADGKGRRGSQAATGPELGPECPCSTRGLQQVSSLLQERYRAASGQGHPGARRPRAKGGGRHKRTDLGSRHRPGRPGWRCSPRSARCRRRPRSGPAAPPGPPGRWRGGKKQKHTKTKNTIKKSELGPPPLQHTPKDRTHLSRITST